MSFLWECECGAANSAKDSACQYCGKLANGKAIGGQALGHQCQDCQVPIALREIRYGPEDGLKRCGSCHVAHLKQRAQPTESVCFCGLTVRQHIDSYKQAVAEYEARTQLPRAPQSNRPSQETMREALTLLRGGKP